MQHSPTRVSRKGTAHRSSKPSALTRGSAVGWPPFSLDLGPSPPTHPHPFLQRPLPTFGVPAERGMHPLPSIPLSSLDANSQASYQEHCP